MLKPSGSFNYELCADCGGKCCKVLAGGAFPEDFKLPLLDSLVGALCSGDWAVDWWEGDPRKGKNELAICYFIRPAHTNAVGEVKDPSWGGVCVFLTDIGCKLPEQDRPKSCRHLKPIAEADGSCTSGKGTNKESTALAWLPYQAEIEQAIEQAEAIKQAQEDAANTDAMREMYGDEADHLMDIMPDIGNK